MRTSVRRCASSIHEIRAGRQLLAQQFSSLDGWQSGQDVRFDAYVEKQRRQEAFDGFDQRVERAYHRSAALHKAEVVNGFKRQATTLKQKVTVDTLREMNQAVESRLEWLREVWAQIDSDYRSTDVRRQEAAAEEISKALRGEASDFMATAYEKKRDARFSGPKGKLAAAAADEDANLPEISEHEANRYLNLKLNMHEIERNVKAKYGIAGHQHWAMLQSEKNAEYEDKLDKAVAQYKELIDQQNRHDESQRTQHVRSVMERTHEARVRFQAAMEIETERERMIEAHVAMQKERQEQAAEQARQQLREAAEMKAAGKTTAEVAQALKQKVLDEAVKRQDEYRFEEKQAVLKKKETFLGIISKMRRNVEVREGSEMMTERDALVEAPSTSSSTAVFGFDDDDAAKAPQQHMRGGKRLSETQQKQDLWREIHADAYEDPFVTVHQARLDADQTYDPLYMKMNGTELVQGRQHAHQGLADQLAGNEGDRFLLKSANEAAKPYQWGNAHGIVHNLDGDGETQYFLSDVYHVRDKKTGDIDWTRERRAGGPLFSGPKFYKIGERREAKDPGNKTVVPAPPKKKRGGVPRSE